MEFSSDEKKILKELNLLSQLENSENTFRLQKKSGRWILEQPVAESGLKEGKAVLEINFQDANYNRILQKKSDLLWKAMGKPKSGVKVLDLTCGLAIDSFHFLQLGAEVTAVERQALIYFLLWSASLELPKDRPIQFVFREAKDFLNSRSNLAQDFNIVYFDPMYPDKKKKSAIPRQEMLLFRHLVGQDLDADEVFDEITKTQVDKIIVKRPLHAESLKSGSPAYLKPIIYQGKMVRYDVYNRK